MYVIHMLFTYTSIHVCAYTCIYIHRFINHLKLIGSHYQALLNNDVLFLLY